MDITNLVKLLAVFWLTRRLERPLSGELTERFGLGQAGSAKEKRPRAGKVAIAFGYLEN